MMPADKSGLLKSFLGALRGQSVARLAMAVEVDRLMEGQELPHEDILESLRPALRRDHFERTLTPLRLFCRPFQDLLTTCPPRKTKQKGVIARSSLVPIWVWVSRTLLPAESQAFVREEKALILGHRTDDAIARAAQFWPLAAAAMKDAMQDGAARKLLENTLGDVFAVEDAAEIALLLPAGEMIEKLAALLPKPVTSFTEPLVWAARDVYDQMVIDYPDVAPYVAVMVMNRLNRPWEALRLPMLVTRKNDETLIAKTDMGLVGEILFDRMEKLKESLQQTRHPLFDADKLIEEASTFAALSSRIAKEIELKREGEWGRKLLGERVLIGKVMENFMDRAAREVSAGLPMSKGKGGDFSKHPSAEKREMALRYVRLVAGCRTFAAAASFAAKQKAVDEELCTLLKRYNEDVVKALKNDPDNDVAAAQFQLSAEMTALLFSEEEAEFLRRRGRAALNAAA